MPLFACRSGLRSCSQIVPPGEDEAESLDYIQYRAVSRVTAMLQAGLIYSARYVRNDFLLTRLAQVLICFTGSGVFIYEVFWDGTLGCLQRKRRAGSRDTGSR